MFRNFFWGCNDKQLSLQKSKAVKMFCLRQGLLLPWLWPWNRVNGPIVKTHTQNNTSNTLSLHEEGYCLPTDGEKGKAAQLCSSATSVKPKQIRHCVASKWVEGNMVPQQKYSNWSFLFVFICKMTLEGFRDSCYLLCPHWPTFICSLHLTTMSLCNSQ